MPLSPNLNFPKLFVSGFPLDISELDLARLIAPYGDIATIKIVRDRKTRLCKGYAFVELQTLAGAEAVIKELNGRLVADRFLAVKLVEELSKPQTKTAHPAAVPDVKFGCSKTAAEKHTRPRKRLNA